MVFYFSFLAQPYFSGEDDLHLFPPIRITQPKEQFFGISKEENRQQREGIQGIENHGKRIPPHIYPCMNRYKEPFYLCILGLKDLLHEIVCFLRLKNNGEGPRRSKKAILFHNRISTSISLLRAEKLKVFRRQERDAFIGLVVHIDYLLISPHA
jgi:hypothetical protein